MFFDYFQLSWVITVRIFWQKCIIEMPFHCVFTAFARLYWKETLKWNWNIYIISSNFIGNDKRISLEMTNFVWNISISCASVSRSTPPVCVTQSSKRDGVYIEHKLRVIHTTNWMCTILICFISILLILSNCSMKERILRNKLRKYSAEREPFWNECDSLVYEDRKQIMIILCSLCVMNSLSHFVFVFVINVENIIISHFHRDRLHMHMHVGRHGMARIL